MVSERATEVVPYKYIIRKTLKNNLQNMHLLIGTSQVKVGILHNYEFEAYIDRYNVIHLQWRPWKPVR